MASESAAGHVSEDLVAWCRCEAGWTGAGCGEVLGQCSNGEVDEASGESDVDCGSAASGCGGCGAGYMCATSGDCLGDLVCYGESGDASGGRCLSPVLSGFGRVVRFGLSLWGVRKSLYGSAGMGEVLLRVLRDVLGGDVEVVVVDVSEEELSAGGGADAAWWRRVLGGVGAGETEGVFLGATVVEVYANVSSGDEADASALVSAVESSLQGGDFARGVFGGVADGTALMGVGIPGGRVDVSFNEFVALPTVASPSPTAGPVGDGGGAQGRSGSDSGGWVNSVGGIGVVAGVGAVCGMAVVVVGVVLVVRSRRGGGRGGRKGDGIGEEVELSGSVVNPVAQAESSPASASRYSKAARMARIQEAKRFSVVPPSVNPLAHSRISLVQQQHS
ncbi:unnamed protein product [Symbiodinium sp. KB8]|nr:unnamed protein product [Symbiodinium sp. KB8]